MKFTTTTLVLKENTYNIDWRCEVCDIQLELFKPYTAITEQGETPKDFMFSGIFGWTCLSEECINTWLLQHI